MRLASAVIPLFARRKALASVARPHPAASSRRRSPLDVLSAPPAPARVPPIALDPDIDLAQRVRESGEW